MKLSKERQKETGAFYTPKIWADLAVEYMTMYLGDLTPFYFWDMAAGEGALLDALPEGCERYATTLEWEDYKYLSHEKTYGANCVDFLNVDLSKIQWLQDIPLERLICFTNPPFVKLPASNASYAKRTYKTNDATALFYYRIFKEIKPFLCCSFSKMDLFQAPNMKKVRTELSLWDRLNAIPINPFATNSRTWGLSGEFPIMFSILLGFDLFPPKAFSNQTKM